MSVSTSRVRYRNVVFTKHYEELDEIQILIKTFIELHANGEIQYMIGQHEICPKTFRTHLQGYFEFSQNQQKSLRWIKKYIDPNIHIERRYGSQKQAIEYCMKEESRMKLKNMPIPHYEIGEPKIQGNRSDLMGISDMLADGYSITTVAKTYPSQYIRYNKGIEKLQSRLIKPRFSQPKIIIYYGKSQTGKTYDVYITDCNKPESVYPLPPPRNANDQIWFDGYDNEPILLIDDFNPEHFPATFMIRLLDGYPLRVPVKGGFKQFTSSTIYITSNYSPSLWTQSMDFNSEEHGQALINRLKKAEIWEYEAMNKRKKYVL